MHAPEGYTLSYFAILSPEPSDLMSSEVENDYFGKMTGKHGDTVKDRDKKGARFRDVMINRRKVQAQT